MGSRVSENAGAAPGYISAFNIRTGNWHGFNTIPKPGEFGYDTWPEDAWKTAGGVNSWAGMSLDEARGIVLRPNRICFLRFLGRGQERCKPFRQLATGPGCPNRKRIWHFQTVHHDIWDRDLPAPPNLLTVNHSDRHLHRIVRAHFEVGPFGIFCVVNGKAVPPVILTDVIPGQLNGATLGRSKGTDHGPH